MTYSQSIGWGADMIIEGVWVGSLMSSMNLASLEGHGITHIINCTRVLPCLFPEHFHYLHIKLRDQTHQNIISTFPRAIAFINEVQKQGGSVLIHCAGGSSRSGTTAIAFLLSRDLNAKEKSQRGVDEMIAFAQTRRPVIEPNPGFLEQLHLFHSWKCALPDNPTLEQQKQLDKYRLQAEILLIERLEKGKKL